jgi:cholesterol oxidase
MLTETLPGTLTSYPPFFGVRRDLNCPPLERIDFAAEDGSGLILHHTSGGSKGPVIVTPGTAMTALTYCIDTVPCNLVEFLVAQGFDVWLFDWRTSPLIEVHQRPYTLDDVARYDWPAAVDVVTRRTGKEQVTVLSHCLSSPCFLLSLLRGYLRKERIRAFIASQVALHLNMTPVGTVKLATRMDRLLPGLNMIHQKPAELTGQISDSAVSVLAAIIPKSYSCNNHACHRHSASFGDVIFHPRLNSVTHNIMGDLIPECLTAFLKDVAVWGRKKTVLTKEDMGHLDRLKLPIHFISGSENHMFIPKSTERTYQTLCDWNGPEHYRRTVYPGFGHLDCFVGDGARESIWPDFVTTLA